MSKLQDPNIEGFKILQNLIANFWNSKHGEFVNGTDSADGEPYIWPVSICVQSVIDGARINKNFLPTVQQMMNVFHKYYNPKMHGYSAAYNNDGSNRDIYYDDDAQVATCFLTAYEVTQDKGYLDAAVDLVNFLMTGKENDGGVKWHVDKPGSNSCTTAEVGIACAQLARFVSNNKPYLQFADYCYEFIFQKMVDPDDGLVCDGFDGGKGLDKMKWTYNQGTPLTLCAYLYGHTKDDKYFQSARKLAQSVTNPQTQIFDRDTQNMDVRFYRDGTKFYQLLTEGFADYLLFFADKDKETADKVSHTAYRMIRFMYEFIQLPGNKAWYAETLEPYKIDKGLCDAFNKLTGENKQYEPAASEHQKGDVNKPLAPSMMATGSAARCFFQTARIWPHVDF